MKQRRGTWKNSFAIIITTATIVISIITTDTFIMTVACNTVAEERKATTIETQGFITIKHHRKNRTEQGKEEEEEEEEMPRIDSVLVPNEKVSISKSTRSHS